MKGKKLFQITNIHNIVFSSHISQKEIHVLKHNNQPIFGFVRDIEINKKLEKSKGVRSIIFCVSKVSF